MTEPTHYEVLAIPKSLIEDTNKEQIPKIIKQAYHRALLRHHPDKTNTPHRTTAAAAATAATTTTPPTVDQIALAYTTLSCPAERAAYNRQLALTRNPTAAPGDNSAAGGSTTFQTGIETIDLDDLDYSEAGATTRWHRSCRCGNEEGFAFGEDDLEEAGDLGELIVGCQDCSLWLRVCFAVVEDDVDDGVGGGGGGSGGGVIESDGVSSKDEISRGGPLGHAAQSTGQPG